MRGIASQDRSCRYFHTLAAVNRFKQRISNFRSTTCRIRSPLAEYVLILAQPARANNSLSTAVLRFYYSARRLHAYWSITKKARGFASRRVLSDLVGQAIQTDLTQLVNHNTSQLDDSVLVVYLGTHSWLQF